MKIYRTDKVHEAGTLENATKRQLTVSNVSSMPGAFSIFYLEDENGAKHNYMLYSKSSDQLQKDKDIDDAKALIGRSVEGVFVGNKLEGLVFDK